MSPAIFPPLVRVDLVMVGFGHVGRRFTQLLGERRVRLEREDGLACRVVGVATRRHGMAVNPAGLDADAALVLAREGGRLDQLHDPDTGPPPSTTRQLIEQVGTHRARDTQTPLAVVETTVLDIERAAAALDHVRAAFAVGAHVITANKGPAAFAYRELAEQAEAVGVSFLTEGAVLDGVPVFNLVRETLPAVEVIGFRGVVNSTTNHVLTALEAGGEQADAVAAMQAAGIAEADVSLDLDGWDAAAKTAVLINVLMGGSTTPHDIDRTGIRQLSGERVRDATRRGRRIKLVASAARTAGRVAGRVAPDELAADDPLARLDGVANAVILTTDLLGDVMIGELDAGLTHTAYALLSDLVTIRRRQTAAPGAAPRHTRRPRSH